MKVKERNILPISQKKATLRVGLVYPNKYKAGMSSYTVHLLYSLFNQFDSVRCERFFLPERIKYPLKRQVGYSGQHTKMMKSVELGTPLSEMDIIAITLQFELDYLNVLWIIDSIGIPLTIEDRTNREENCEDGYPLIIAGGPCMRSNPLTMLPFIDMIIFNDFEPIIHDFMNFFKYNLDSVRNFNFQFLKNPEKFRTLVELPNLLISTLAIIYLENSAENQKLQDYYYSFPKERIVLDKLENQSAALHQIIPEFKSDDDDLVFGETYLIEINRGCPYNCKFCMTGCLTKPFRNRSYTDIINIIEHYVSSSGVKKVTFIGSAIADHPKFGEILQYLVDRDYMVMVPSIRLEKLNKEILSLLKRGGLKSITIAPETGSESLRYNLNKKVSNVQIISKLHEVAQSGFRSVKLYFLINLPEERNDDLTAISDLADQILQGIQDTNPNFSLKLSINFAIPKLGTPFAQNCNNYRRSGLKILKTKVKMLKNILKQRKNVEYNIMDAKLARIQTILSLMDENGRHVLMEYYEMGGKPNHLKRIESSNEYVENLLSEVATENQILQKLRKLIEF